MIIDNPSPSVGPDGVPVQAGQTPSMPAAEGANVPAEPPPPAPPAPPAAGEPAPQPPVDDSKKWYVVKVQSGREESIKDAIERRVKIEGLQESFGQILIPTEKYTEVNRNNKRVTKERKLFPGYIMVHLEFNDRMLYLFRETSGVGDFVGGGLNKPPQPMSQKEVERMLIKASIIEPTVEAKSKFDKGDKVKVKDGTFAGMEGEVKEVMEAKGALRVALTIFGREVPVELEYWQVDYA
jgi:transcriptional antiterminator NusG